MHATLTAKVESWDEKPFRELEDGRKLTRASVKQTISGDLAGECSVEWLMAYRADGTADYVGYAFVEGLLTGRAGTFAVRTVGTFDGKEASGSWDIVDGSAAGDLQGLSGSGTFTAPHGSEASVELDYSLS